MWWFRPRRSHAASQALLQLEQGVFLRLRFIGVSSTDREVGGIFAFRAWKRLSDLADVLKKKDYAICVELAREYDNSSVQHNVDEENVLLKLFISHIPCWVSLANSPPACWNCLLRKEKIGLEVSIRPGNSDTY